MNKELKLIFTGGGSGGHTMPALAVIESLKDFSKKKNIKIQTLFIGSHCGVEKGIIKKNKIDYKSINTGKLRRYISAKNFFDIFNVIIGLVQSFFIIKNFKPCLLVSTGGFVSIPPVIMAGFLKVPIIIHEQTIDAGLANKIAGRFADKIALTFPESRKYFNPGKSIVTGLPIRKFIFEGNKKNAYKNFGLNPKLKTIYFTGGALGCHILNEVGLKIVPILLSKYNIIYQTGKSKDNLDYYKMVELKRSLRRNLQNRFVVFDFIQEEIKEIYAIADLAVARSGAGTVCELSALCIPAVFIPLAIATNNEQYKNARSIETINGAVIIEEKELNEENLLKKINQIFAKGKIEGMKKNLKKNASVNGTDKFLTLIAEMIK
jgi:UDP-N-acetylglucosamine--N-acetylmuramyl-(pentapeptide) pyrophosphoryl-undecaprenol N-acetylglucosamine transferase